LIDVTNSEFVAGFFENGNCVVSVSLCLYCEVQYHNIYNWTKKVRKLEHIFCNWIYIHIIQKEEEQLQSKQKKCWYLEFLDDDDNDDDDDYHYFVDSEVTPLNNHIWHPWCNLIVWEKEGNRFEEIWNSL
jgi:hypothetical protein